MWVHHNSVVSGDGAYQACQPLDTSLWVNVSSDDVLFEDNLGSSVASAFILVGLSHVTVAHSNFVCSNVTFQSMQGSGIRALFVQAAAAPNTVERVTLRNLALNVTRYNNFTPASIQISALYGGVVRSVLMEGVRVLGTLVTSLNETGSLENVVFANGGASRVALAWAP
jgi:hypothetical protein